MSISRVILKISGEALKEENNTVSQNKLEMIYNTIKLLQDNYKKVAIVIGGGNFFRGREHPTMSETERDTIGMLSSVINALYLKDYLTKKNIESIISTPFNFNSLIDNYNDNELQELYNKDNVIIFGGGVGMCGYSTDSGVILGAHKLHPDLIIKMTNVDGIYDDDPKINSNAQMYSYLSYQDILNNSYKIMDKYAIEECSKLGIKILVMNFNNYQKLQDYFNGQNIGTLVGGSK